MTLLPTIKQLLSMEAVGQPVIIRGWVRTKRETKQAIFIEVNDGSCLSNIQCVLDSSLEKNQSINDTILRLSTGASVEIHGELVPSPAKGQKIEVKCQQIKLIGEAPSERYPLQKKHIASNFCVKLRTSGCGQILLLQLPAFEIGWHFAITPVFSRAWLLLHPHTNHYHK